MFEGLMLFLFAAGVAMALHGLAKMIAPDPPCPERDPDCSDDDRALTRHWSHSDRWPIC